MYTFPLRPLSLVCVCVSSETDLSVVAIFSVVLLTAALPSIHLWEPHSLHTVTCSALSILILLSDLST